MQKTKVPEIELTNDPLKNIQTMAPHLSEQQQRDVSNVILGVYLCTKSEGKEPEDSEPQRIA